MQATKQLSSLDREVAKQRPPQSAAQNFKTSCEQTHPAAVVQRTRLAPGSLTPQAVLRLQRAIGNRAVGRLLAGASSKRDGAASVPVLTAPPAVIQRAVVSPVMTPAGGKANAVTLDLAAGDTTDTGGAPTVEPDGWRELKLLGLTTGKDNWHKWVRFHMLNEDEGGPDDTDNLVPTTQKANHDRDWMDFERDLHRAATDPTQRPLAFTATVDYYPARTVQWGMQRGNVVWPVTTNSDDYPRKVQAQVKVNGVVIAVAALDDDDGLIRPEDLRHVPYSKTRTEQGTATAITGDKP